jgi:NADH-quinone oxidoreductase subunit F
MVERIESIDALKAIKQQVKASQAEFRLRLMICGSNDCHLTGSDNVKSALDNALQEKGLKNQIQIVETGCIGSCSMGPVMTVLPEEIFYMKLQAEDVQELVESHLIKGVPVQRLMYHDPTTGKTIPRRSDIPFFALQQSFVLHNKGLIDPSRIEDYIWRDGYQAMFKSLTEQSPSEIISEIKASGLRGRGGGGFPTGMKWEFCVSTKSDVKYVLCNADEGDPGAFMDRRIMEDDPHSILEGMVIGAKAINANQGYIYCRAEYPLAIKRLTGAISQAEERGLLGRNIMGTGFDFHVDIYQGAGAFVCGEETALMTSIEGKRGTPRPRPPFPAVSGLWGKPSILNNVETWSSVPQILLRGGDAYARIGTESAKGTKVFAVTGKVNHIGLVEVPMGTSIGKIIFDISGGIPNNKKFKAAQLGGPSGGCVPSDCLNMPTDYEEIVKAGAIMGSGGMIVMDEDTCMVDMARYFMDFCQDESCGKCTPCRVGTKRMLQILENICKGKGRIEDIELLESLSVSIRDTALCGLGQTAPNPVLSTLRYFIDEYKAHIIDKKCPAGVCADLFTSPCQNACPVEMEIPAYIAMVRAGRFDDAYRILKRTNPFPSVCGRVCSHPCQSKCRRGQLDESLAIKNIKRFITDHATPPEIEALPVTHSEKIAVIGAGPAGMTAALEMKKRGYAVTVFEALPEAGGMLRWGIPEYRLPRNILAREIQEILDTGVELKTDVKIGEDLPFSDLEKSYDAIYIGVGAQKSMPLGLANEDARGVMGAVEFLRSHSQGEAVTVGINVAVIGGGNSAIDAARTALRLGAQSVKIIYRRERKDMPALDEEIRAAEEEGVSIEYLVVPIGIRVRDGKMQALKLVRMQLGPFDASGRRKPVAIEGDEFVIPVDTLIPAIGQVAELELISEKIGLDMIKTRIHVNKDFSTSHPKVWAGGDVVTGPAMVIDAIAAGQKAAVAMDQALRAAKEETPWKAFEEKIDIPFEVDEDTVEQPQAKMPELDPENRCRNFAEVELGYDRETALREACRCIRCDAELEQ